jgi:hypothetical protein
MTIKSPAKIIKQVVYISKDVTDVVTKGMSNNYDNYLFISHEYINNDSSCVYLQILCIE